MSVVQPGERVYAVLFPAGGGFAELALAWADRLAPMPGTASFVEAAGLVIGAGTAYEGLIDRGRLQAGETVLITAAAGGVGSAAVQIAVAMGARVVAVASPPNHDYLRSLGASEVFDYHAAGWALQVRAVVPGGVGLLFDGAGGQTRDQGITGESFAAHGGRPRLEQLAALVDSGKLRPQAETVLPLGTPGTMTVRVVAGIQNGLFWRVGTGRLLSAAFPLRDGNKASRAGQRCVGRVAPDHGEGECPRFPQEAFQRVAGLRGGQSGVAYELPSGESLVAASRAPGCPPAAVLATGLPTRRPLGRRQETIPAARPGSRRPHQTYASWQKCNQ